MLLNHLLTLTVWCVTTLGASLDKCPGYKATNVRQSGNSLTADLTLAGKPCNTYGKDLTALTLQVKYETDSRLHVMVYDTDEDVYQVPDSVFSRPSDVPGAHHSTLKFDYKKNPFSFSVSRADTKEVLFDTSISNLVFQSQYLNLRTALPESPNLYGLGEHTDSLRLPTTNYTRTLWSRDAYGIPNGTNLYGNHPIYVDHRGNSGTHGVFLLNSNGMDIKIDQTDEGQQYLEYNTLGGIFDLYFLAGPTPKDVSAQYASLAGLPAMMSYWTFGFHQCRYGYQDIFEVAEVVYNYSEAKIPLETMWTDIDYMDNRVTFSTDPDRFPLHKMRELVDYLHDHQQHYILMTDPAMSYSDNGAFNRGSAEGIFMKTSNSSIFQGVVWPGITAFPDWFNPDAQSWWTNEFQIFFDPENGVNVDGLWIDMNEASNFCSWPCSDPAGYAKANGFPPTPPPVRANPRTLPGFPSDFQPESSKRSSRRDGKGQKRGLPGRDLIDPPYTIANAAGSLSNKTIDTDLVHAGEGYVEYDTHNLYGTMMSYASRSAMLSRRPTVRPLVITRSTFSGAGSHVGHWLGDNLSTWEKYRISIAEMLAFASIFHLPMIGSDVCGFGMNTTETLCARWALLGAFYPFYRNHNEAGNIPQEFYRWPTVADAARKVIDIRYRLLDYLYTSFQRQTTTGEPFLQPLFYIYPNDANTYPIDLQFFFGDALLVSPVTNENSTLVEAYFPDDIFYDWYTGAPFRGHGTTQTLDNIDFTTIPLHIRGGSIIPTRTTSANTTTELRTKGFNIIIAPGLDGTAKGSLYMDDGDSLNQPTTLEIDFSYKHGHFQMSGSFAFHTDVQIESVTVLGQSSKPSSVNGSTTRILNFGYSANAQSVTLQTNLTLTGPAELTLG